MHLIESVLHLLNVLHLLSLFSGSLRLISDVQEVGHYLIYGSDIGQALLDHGILFVGRGYLILVFRLVDVVDKIDSLFNGITIVLLVEELFDFLFIIMPLKLA